MVRNQFRFFELGRLLVWRYFPRRRTAGGAHARPGFHGRAMARRSANAGGPRSVVVIGVTSGDRLAAGIFNNLDGKPKQERLVLHDQQQRLWTVTSHRSTGSRVSDVGDAADLFSRGGSV
jgi:hypothetical protein